MSKKLLCIFLFIFIIALSIAYTQFNLGQYLSLDYLKSEQESLIAHYQSHPSRTMLLFVLIYTVFTIMMIPGATILTLAGGAIFGFWWGSILVSLGSTLGATVSFLGARFLFREHIQNRFHHKLTTINRNFEKDGLFYLFTLRVIPIFPYFVINVMVGLTKIGLLSYVFISGLGMFIVTMVYVNAGTQLAQLRSIQGILSPSLLISFALIGIFPLLAKFGINYWKSRR